MISERISNDIPSEHGYPHSNALLQSGLKSKSYMLHKTANRQTKCEVINDVKLFQTVYHRIFYQRIFCRKFLALPIRGPVTKANALEYLFASFKTYLLITWMDWSKLSTGKFLF